MSNQKTDTNTEARPLAVPPPAPGSGPMMDRTQAALHRIRCAFHNYDVIDRDDVEEAMDEIHRLTRRINNDLEPQIRKLQYELEAAQEALDE